MKPLLIDNLGSVRLQFTEDNDNGKLIARGEFAMCDRPTANGRIYSRALMEREIGKLLRNLKERKVMGELDHPADGRTKLARVSHLLTSLEIEPDGRVVGEAEILGTEKGKILKELYSAGVRVGVSSRGHGTTTPAGNGTEMVNEDYNLMTFDFVADPADATALPEVYTEADQAVEKQPIENNTDAEPDMGTEITLEAVKENQDVYEAVLAEAKEQAKKELEETAPADDKAELKKKFTEQLEATILKERESLREEEYAKLMSDPEIGLAKKHIDTIKDIVAPFVLPEDVQAVVDEKDEEIKKLQERVVELEGEVAQKDEDYAQLEDVSRKVGNALHIERVLRGADDEDLVKAQISDMTFESFEAIDAKVEEIREATRKITQEQQERNAENSKLREENEKLRVALKTAEEALNKSHELSKQMGIKTYTEQKLSGHAKAPRLRKLIENRIFATKEEVDTFFENFDEVEPVSEEFTNVREKLTRAPKHVQQRQIVEGVEDSDVEGLVESSNTKNSGQIEDVLGTSVVELRRLSGIGV